MACLTRSSPLRLFHRWVEGPRQSPRRCFSGTVEVASRSKLVQTRCLSTTGRAINSPSSPQHGPRYADLVLQQYRSSLAVPADSERKLRKSAKCGADVCLVDLEDGVVRDRKNYARELLRGLLPRLLEDYNSSTNAMIRLNCRLDQNDQGRYEFEEDVAMLASLERLPQAVGLAKVNSADDVRVCMEHLDKTLPKDSSPLGIFLMVESPEAVINLPRICESLLAHAQENRFLPGGLCFGHGDYCASLEIDITTSDRSKLTFAEQAIVTTAKAFRLQAIDCVYTVVDDLEGLRADALHGARTGFTGKCAIHPSHIPVINEVFSPSDKHVEWARGLLNAYANLKQEEKGVFVYEGQLVDSPAFRRAERIIASARESIPNDYFNFTV